MDSKKVIVEINSDDRIQDILVSNTTRARKRAGYEAALRALTLIACGTKMTTASVMTGIPHRTIKYWMAQQWGKEVVGLIRDKLDDHLDSSFTAIAHTANEVVLDRLENGDFVKNKDGSLSRIPVSAKDAMITGSIAFDKRSLLRGKPTSITESQQSTDDRLTTLAEKFRNIAIAGDYEVVIEDENQQE